MRLSVSILVAAVTLLASTDAAPTASNIQATDNNEKLQGVSVQDTTERLLKRRGDDIDDTSDDAAELEERVNSAAVAKLTKSSSAKYKTWWNKALSSIFKSLTPKNYRASEAKMTTNTGRYHPFRIERN